MRTGWQQTFDQGDMVNDFFGQEQQHQGPQQRNMSAFELSQLHRELELIGDPQQRQPSSGWASEFPMDGRPNDEAAMMERAFMQSRSAAKAPAGMLTKRDV